MKVLHIFFFSKFHSLKREKKKQKIRLDTSKRKKNELFLTNCRSVFQFCLYIRLRISSYKTFNLLSMFLKQSTYIVLRVIMYLWRWPSYLPKISFNVKYEWKTWQNLGRTKEKGSKLKFVIRPKSRHILLTFDQEDLQVAENIFSLSQTKR